jgi:hypothetical protein
MYCSFIAHDHADAGDNYYLTRLDYNMSQNATFRTDNGVAILNGSLKRGFRNPFHRAANLARVTFGHKAKPVANLPDCVNCTFEVNSKNGR